MTTTQVLLDYQGQKRLIIYYDQAQAEQDVQEVNTFLRRQNIPGEASIVPAEEYGTSLIDYIDEAEPGAKALEAAGWRRETGLWSSHQGENGEELDLNDASIQLAQDALIHPVLNRAAPHLVLLFGDAATTLTLYGAPQDGALCLTGFRVQAEDDKDLDPEFEWLTANGVIVNGEIPTPGAPILARSREEYWNSMVARGAMERLSAALLTHPAAADLAGVLRELLEARRQAQVIEDGVNNSGAQSASQDVAWEFTVPLVD